ncbi:DNA-binding protein HEXBP-like [Camellia sinensis]|uniref:DNA-binding protein HEXBP-like n=1 Tax=Camellia sinensis TaxID=4442 RepID=UPI0010365C98|nr:DNA-binding protein HEXBP-like [Camellia sinensis]
MTCFRCGQQGHKALTCPQREGRRLQQRLAPSQTQFQGSGRVSTYYQCEQLGHVKRLCPQLVEVASASGSQQSHNHPPVLNWEQLQQSTLSQDREPSTSFKCNQLGHVKSNFPQSERDQFSDPSQDDDVMGE